MVPSALEFLENQGSFGIVNPAAPTDQPVITDVPFSSVVMVIGSPAGESLIALSSDCLAPSWLVSGRRTRLAASVAVEPERNCHRMVNFRFCCSAMSTRYSRSEFLNTLETIEFNLDFSTGVMAGGETVGIVVRPDWTVGLFSEKGSLSL